NRKRNRDRKIRKSEPENLTSQSLADVIRDGGEFPESSRIRRRSRRTLLRQYNSGPHRRRRRTLRQDLANAPDLGAYAAQLFLNVLVAAIDVIDAVDNRFAVCNQGS